MGSMSLYIDLSKAIKFDVPLASKVHALSPGRSSQEADYSGVGPKPNDGRSWEPTSGGGWRTFDPAGQPSKAGQEKGPEKKPSLEERQIDKDPTKELASAPGVESKQSILSGKKEDFKDHSVSDHYKIMNEVSHDPKLWDMHSQMANEKSKNMTAAEHQQVSDDMHTAHMQQGNNVSFGVVAEMHADRATAATQAAEKTKEAISAETGQKEMGRQVAGAKLDDKKEKLTIEGFDPNKPIPPGGGGEFDPSKRIPPGGSPGMQPAYTTDTHATHEEASAAHKKDKETLTQQFEDTKKRHKDLSDTAKDSVGDKPKASDYAEGKVPPKAKSDYEKRKANADYMKEIAKQMAEEAKQSHKEKKDEHTAKKPKAADWKAKEKEAAQVEKEAAQVEEDIPKPPTSDLERAEVTGHTSKAKELIDNINSHIDSGELSDEDLSHLNSIRDAMAEHQSLTTIPSKKHKTDLKLAQTLAGEHGKKPYEEAAAPKAAGQPRSAGVGRGAMSAFQSGRMAGEQIGEAAGSQEGGGAIGSAAITYAAQGAVSAGGHFLLDKDVQFAVPKKSPLLTQKQLKGGSPRGASS